VVVEVDGPHHYEPIWGHERLQKVQAADMEKNGLLISRGFKVVRIKNMAKTVTDAFKERLWNCLKSTIDNLVGGADSNKVYYVEG
jgi:very-short-patch-repair endonuclease